MSRINLLPENIYNKIAAGEVIERPASVLKELVENSLDAGAGRICIRIGGAGTSLIAVSDDGCGMDKDDALLCFEPHATSKIRTERDLDGITSLGFRGEALPSIASVSRITLRTRQKDASEGVETVIEGGKMLYCRPSGCASGTEITIRDLFFNTPARKKFLKKNATEEKHIVEMLTNIALAHAGVTFELFFDGKKFLSSPGASKIDSRVRELFGKEYGENMLPLAFTEKGIKVAGLIAKRTFTRTVRAEQRIFVNARPVESLAVYKGIKEGFGPTLDKGKYPPCVLYLSMPPEQVDVNVHPAKREVRFLSDFEVTSVVRNAVGNALRAYERSILGFAPDLGVLSDDEGQSREIPLKIHSPVQKENSAMPLPPAENDPQEQEELRQAFAEIRNNRSLLRDMPPASWDKAENIPAKEALKEPPALQKENFSGDPLVKELLASAHVEYLPSVMRTPVQQASSLPGFEENPLSGTPEEGNMQEKKENAPLGLHYIGVLADSYILAERDETLVVIDQHAAHERVLFERLLKSTKGDILSQKLLLPVVLELSRSDTAFLARNKENILRLGFEAEEFGMNTVKLNAIPAALSQEDAGGVFKEMLALAAEEDSSRVYRSDLDKVAMAACKAAVKAHDKIPEKEIRQLLQQLSDCEQPFACPHGRPTIVNITIKELERRFGRR